jgi:hypothetical protein
MGCSSITDSLGKEVRRIFGIKIELFKGLKKVYDLSVVL